MTNTARQIILFRRAIALLGGQRATARLIGVNERTIRDIARGARPIHTGFLRDVSVRLLAHADECRMVERLISPAFPSNLTAEQMARRPHGRAYHLRARAEG